MVPSDTPASGSRADLPLPDYDHLPLPSLIQRIRSLDVDQLTVLETYERAHGNRLPVTEAFRTRLAELEAGADPSSVLRTGEKRLDRKLRGKLTRRLPGPPTGSGRPQPQAAVPDRISN